jgi:hypothetical protein
MFVDMEAQYMPRSYPLDEEEYRLLNTVRNDDVLVLTKNPLPNAHNIREGLQGR